jgi:chemotaxis protein methyltransferase CheR
MTISIESFGFVSDLVRRESAIVLEPGKEYLVESRLSPLARKAGVADVDDFVRSLRTRFDPAVSQQVVEALTTNETSWFRDNEPFAALRDQVLPDLARHRPSRSLRVWSAACSSGQEPYSIAMTALDTPAVTGWRFEVLGTDLSEEMVERARTGRYSQLEVNRGLPAATLVRHFTRSGPHWQIAPAVTEAVSFRKLNLTRPFPGLGTFDVIFMRNVLIYFDMATKRDILRRVRQVLAPDGYLFLGAAETTLGVDEGWQRHAAGRSSLYRLSTAR